MEQRIIATKLCLQELINKDNFDKTNITYLIEVLDGHLSYKDFLSIVLVHKVSDKLPIDSNTYDLEQVARSNFKPQAVSNVKPVILNIKPILPAVPIINAAIIPTVPIINTAIISNVKPIIPNSKQIIPTNINSKHILPTNINIKPIIPTNINIKPILPTNINIKPILPTNINSKHILPTNINSKPILPINLNIKPVNLNNKQQSIPRISSISSRANLVINEKGELNDIIADTVDIFDFVTYIKEYTMMELYFSNLTLDIRTALLIDYKYNYLHPNDRGIFDTALNSKSTFNDKKSFLELTLDVFDPYYIVYQWYRHYNPDKILNDSEFVDKLVEKYAHREVIMFNCLYRVYRNKQWVNEPLWFG